MKLTISSNKSQFSKEEREHYSKFGFVFKKDKYGYYTEPIKIEVNSIEDLDKIIKYFNHSIVINNFDEDSDNNIEIYDDYRE